MSVARGFPNGGNFYSNLVKPIKIDCNFIVDATNGNGLGIRSLKSNGYVRNVFMHTSTTPGSNDGYLNPNPASGYALIQLKQNFNAYLGGFSGFVSPTTGGTHVINGSALTIGSPYIIAAVGATPNPKFTVVTVADSAGSLASKYFLMSDAYSNNYVIWFQVAGVGTPPSLTGTLASYQAVPVAIASGAANTAVATALSTVIGALNNSNSFTTGVVGHTVTATNAAAVATVQPSPAPVDFNTGFTISGIVYTTLAADWQHVGLPPGLTPTVGQSFIATATGGALGSGTTISPGVSGISSIEVIGDPNTSINNSSIATNGGAWLLVQFLGSSLAGTVLGTHSHDLLIKGGQAASTTNDVAVYTAVLGKEAATDATILGSASAASGGVLAASAGTPAGTISYAAAAPAAGSVIGMSFFFDGSSVTVDGL